MAPRSTPDDPGHGGTHPPTQHPGDDRMPPYTPGGVPGSKTDEKVNPEDRTKSGWPPKRKP